MGDVMFICPNCNVEYGSKLITCEKCGAKLISEKDFQILSNMMEKWKKLIESKNYNPVLQVCC